MQTLKASEEVAEFIASVNPAKVLAFRPSKETTSRVSELIQQEKNENISSEEKDELDYYMHLEHLMRMAKIMAHKNTVGK